MKLRTGRLFGAALFGLGVCEKRQNQPQFYEEAQIPDLGGCSVVSKHEWKM
jgi:hypothetical protein